MCPENFLDKQLEKKTVGFIWIWICYLIRENGGRSYILDGFRWGKMVFHHQEMETMVVQRTT